MDTFIFVTWIAMCCTAYVFGYWTGLNVGKQNGFKNISKYVEKEWPNRAAAYRKGISEGYDQGLRDGRNDEPA